VRGQESEAKSYKISRYRNTHKRANRGDEEGTMKAAVYARVSTDKQAEKYGISSQIEALRKRILERDGTPVLDGDRDAFVDDGYSGAELDRPALNRLRQAVREGRVDVVLAYDPDRLSRKLYHQMILAEEFEKQGIKLEFITQDMGTSPEDKMFFNMRGLVSEYEREKIRERTVRGSREKARQGKVVSAGAIPFGFSYNKEKATLEENPERARTVRLIFMPLLTKTFPSKAWPIGLTACMYRLPGVETDGGPVLWELC